MSTKIWEAWRIVKPRDLWPLVHDIRVKGTQALEAKVDALYDDFITGVDTTSDEYKKALETYKEVYKNDKPELSEKFARLRVVDTIITEGYKKSVVSPQRDFFDFNCSVGFRQHKGNIYVIRYEGCGARGVLDFMKDDLRLVDYHYQNQSDMPEGMDLKEWGRRKKTWDAIDSGDLWQNVLVIEVCSWDLWTPRIRPYIRFMDRYYKEQRTAQVVTQSAPKAPRARTRGKASKPL